MWSRWKEKLRLRLAKWLGVDDVQASICGLQDARRACIAVDIAVKEHGYLVLLQPRAEGDLVKVWELPAWSYADQMDFIRRTEAQLRGSASLMDAPRSLAEMHRATVLTFQDDGPEIRRPGRNPRRAW